MQPGKMCIDLHCHSIFSDGTASPAELVAMAAKNNLQCLALTDHDTVEGIDDFLACRDGHAIELLAGLEISAMHRQISLHILGYGIDHTDKGLCQWLALVQQGRSERNAKIIGKLRGMGHDIGNDELDAISRCGQTGRPHIAQLLQDKGIVKTREDAFILYLRKGRPAWAERYACSAADSIEIIHRAGGIAVLAHPGLLENQTRALPLIIAELAERGLDGIEAYYPGHTSAAENKLLSLARKYKLVVTGGSDYHGNNRSFSTLAGGDGSFCPPDTLIQPIRDRLETVRKTPL